MQVDREFHDLVSPYLRELRLHCYRMLGSLDDADDLLQETLTAAWQGFDGFAGRSSLRTWLYRIATNRCLNALRAAKRRPVTEPIPPFEPPAPSRRGDVPWLQPCPMTWIAADDEPGARLDDRETVSLAFVSALQRMPPRQVAAMLLCDVLDFSPAEAAGMLETNATAVKGLLQRARRATRESGTNPGPLVEAGTALERATADRFAEAYVASDIDAILSLLTDEAWLAMPPAPHEYLGPAAIAAFLRASAGWQNGRPVRLVRTLANAQPAFAVYLCEPDSAALRFAGVMTLSVVAGGIGGITWFLLFDLHHRFDLPALLD